ncbi:hypothetical protein RI129_005356 [Pyrocoelia pectoralis]|uniref:Carboxylic ester hydrolase n=1 Tax=Pyrocoelia pectoralis TaxID=417401 RepID=A0AAN7ZKA2_9COLE
MLTFSFLFISSLLLSVNSNPHVQIRQGTLKGSIQETWGGTTFLAFQSIPYAEPPVGNLRFQAPKPGKPWEGVLDATKTHVACPQVAIFAYNITTPESEDCLFLNVYTPNTTDLLPVVAFIPGGGFMCDDASIDLYGPLILLDKNLVLVTINYRLGAFGFLSLEDEVMPGNNGLKDQSLALKWIKDNIRSFGGNPDKVTIFGNSAGGASVYFHILSPHSKGLFHAAISSSGIATSTWTLVKKGEANQQCKELAHALKCPTSSSKEILECLQAVNSSDITKQIYKMIENYYEPRMIFKPVIEPKLLGAFITDHPVDIIKSGAFSQVPYIIGLTTDDGALISAKIYNDYKSVKKFNDDFENVVPPLLSYNTLASRKMISRKIKKFYFQDRPIDNDTKSDLTDMFTDAYFYYPQRATIELHSRYSAQPLYFYIFGYRGSFTYLQDYGDTSYDYGVVHCDDLIYLFSDEDLSDHNSTETDLQMRRVMTTLIDNFANTGNPTPHLNSLITNAWKPVKSDKFNYFSIMGPNEIKTKTTFHEERYNFWKMVPFLPELNSTKDEISQQLFK